MVLGLLCCHLKIQIAIRGIYLDGCIIDETAQINSELLIKEVITPALSDRKGFMILLEHQKEWQIFFMIIIKKLKEILNWFLHVAKASETKIVDR